MSTYTLRRAEVKVGDELPLLERVNPDLVSVLIGVNDLVQGRTPE